MNVESSNNSVKENEDKTKNNNNKIENEENKKDLEEESKNTEDIKIYDKINSVPSLMRCYLCEDFCEEPVQILCCNEIFCKKHITEEIMKNFKCPKCNEKAGLNKIIDNKKLAEDIQWFKQLMNENFIQ